jgi:hypothetical protein
VRILIFSGPKVFAVVLRIPETPGKTGEVEGAKSLGKVVAVWPHEHTLFALNCPVVVEELGASVSVNGTMIVSGAPSVIINDTEVGAAYIFADNK